MTTAPLPERFERAKAAFLDGLAALEAGRLDDAERCFRASLADLPGRPSTLINLAATLLELGRPADALATADDALAAEPEALDGWLHRGNALLRLGRNAEALAALERLDALTTPDRPSTGEPPEDFGSLAPTRIAGQLLRAEALERLSRPAEALAVLDVALAEAPDSAEAWSRRGTLLRELDRRAEAADAFRTALRHGAEPTLHGYYLASVDGGPAPEAAPQSYVAALFDDYADDFDAHLVGHLGYRGPIELLGDLAPPAGRLFRHALDLGCGTGLCGPLLRPLAERLTGIDLAPRMVEKARKRGLYDRLEADEIVRFLEREVAGRYDLVVAADVFAYLGDLDPVFAAVRRRIEPGGVFRFTLEALEDDAGDHRLLPSLRYAHAEPYLRRLVAAHGYTVEAIEHRPVREDQRTPIPGLFVRLRA